VGLSITLISDIICPWCFVGKKRLEAAIHELILQDKVTLDIAPYQLYPKTPKEGKNLKSFGKKDHKAVLSEAGAQVGINFRWDLIRTVPNTLYMHVRLMQLPTAPLRWEAKSILLDAYFCKGIDLTQEENVSRLLDSFLLEDTDMEVTIEEKEIFQEARERNISAVPSFVLDGEHHITGAMEKQQWLQFLNRRFAVN